MDIQKIKKEAYTFIQSNKFIEAIELLKQAYDEDPADPEVLFNLAIAHSKLKLEEPALELLNRLLALDSGYIDTLHVQSLRFFLLLRKDLEKDQNTALEKDFKDVLNIYPESIRVLSLYGYFLEKNKRLDEALIIFQKILDLEPADTNAINSYAYLSAKLEKNLDDALKFSGKVLGMHPNNPAYLDSFAMILARKGFSDKAKFAYKKALNLAKDNSSLWETIKKNYEEEVIPENSNTNKK